MSAYCIFDILRIVNAAKMENYRQHVLPTVHRYGGRYLAAGGPFDVVEGDWRPLNPVIIEFPSLAKAHAWYGSEEYRELKALRLEAAITNATFIEGLPPDDPRAKPAG